MTSLSTSPSPLRSIFHQYVLENRDADTFTRWDHSGDNWWPVPANSYCIGPTHHSIASYRQPPASGSPNSMGYDPPSHVLSTLRPVPPPSPHPLAPELSYFSALAITAWQSFSRTMRLHIHPPQGQLSPFLEINYSILWVTSSGFLATTLQVSGTSTCLMR
jgi:hypothetical protein